MFTEEQKVKIRLFLGFPDVFRSGNPRLESAIDVIGDRAETKAMVDDLLEKIEAADEKVNAVLAHAGIKKVDEVEFFGNESGNSSASDARKHGRMLVGRLSIVFGIPIQHDIFSGAGYRTDAWGSHGFQVGGFGGGGVVPLG